MNRSNYMGMARVSASESSSRLREGIFIATSTFGLYPPLLTFRATFGRAEAAEDATWLQEQLSSCSARRPCVLERLSPNDPHPSGGAPRARHREGAGDAEGGPLQSSAANAGDALVLRELALPRPLRSDHGPRSAKQTRSPPLRFGPCPRQIGTRLQRSHTEPGAAAASQAQPVTFPVFNLSAIIPLMSLEFDALRRFLESQMRMSHIYQPLMLRTILQGGGTATTRQIAAAFLAEDESQLEYYEAITNRMPGKVLRRHGVVERNGDRYSLAPNVVGLSPSEIDALIALCDAAITKFKAARGAAIWEHRAVGLGQIPGKLRYETLSEQVGEEWLPSPYGAPGGL